MTAGLETVDIAGVGKRRMGLLVPDSLESSLPRYATAGPVWTHEQIVETIRNRTPRREIFGDSWIKDQNGIGACAGYAGASLLERCRYRSGHQHVQISGDGIYAACNGGRDQGAALERIMRFIAEHGGPPESMVRRHEWRRNRISREAYAEGERFRALEGYFLETETEMASALANDFFVAIAVHAGNGGLSPDGLSDWKNGVGNHSVVVDDLRFRNGRWEFEIANSWGLRWGVAGRGFVTWRNHLSMPIRYHKFYAFRGVINDPKGDNPPAPMQMSV